MGRLVAWMGWRRAPPHSLYTTAHDDDTNKYLTEKQQETLRRPLSQQHLHRILLNNLRIMLLPNEKRECTAEYVAREKFYT